MSLIVLFVIYYRNVCSIPLGDYVVITGGWHDLESTVSRYNKNGWAWNMPSLKQGRHNHGCTAFMSRGQQVRLAT